MTGFIPSITSDETKILAGNLRNFRDPALGINQNRRGFGSPFTGGANFLLGDGSARFLSDKIDPKVLKALSTPNGREPLREF